MSQDIQSEMVKESFLTGVDSNKIRPSVVLYIANTVGKVAESRNDKMTQGIIIYEYLMMADNEFEDSLTKIEDVVNQQLINIGLDYPKIDYYRDKNEDKVIKLFKKVSDEVEQQKESDDEDNEYVAKDAEDERRIRVWLPKYVKEQAKFGRGWSENIEKAVIQGYLTPFTDRYDRLDVKRDILENYKCGDYRRDISREIVNVIDEKVDIESFGDYEDMVNQNTELDIRISWLKQVYDNMPNTSYDAFVGQYKYIHDVKTKTAENAIDKLCYEYEILRADDISEIYVNRNNITDIVKFRGSDKSEKNILIGKMFDEDRKDFATRNNGEVIVDVDKYKNILYQIGVVDDRKRSTTGNFVANTIDYIKYHDKTESLIFDLD